MRGGGVLWKSRPGGESRWKTFFHTVFYRNDSSRNCRIWGGVFCLCTVFFLQETSWQICWALGVGGSSRTEGKHRKLSNLWKGTAWVDIRRLLESAVGKGCWGGGCTSVSAHHCEPAVASRLEQGCLITAVLPLAARKIRNLQIYSSTLNFRRIAQ